MALNLIVARAVIYIRVSSEMQLDGYSLEAQLAACRKLALERGWEVVGVYIEEGVSAKTTERPKFRELLRDARGGRFDVVIVHKLDRFSRSVVDVLGTLHDLEALRVSFVSATEQFDFTTPMGRVMLTMLAAFAQWYLDNLSAETSKGKQARAEAGMWNGDVPFGYKVRYKKDGGDGVPYVDEHEAEGMRLAFEEYAKGDHSDKDIATLLNEAGYRPHGRGRKALALFSKDTLTAMLQNRFYIGEVQYQETWLPGVHEPLITKELFDQCLAVRRQRAPKMPGNSARDGSRAYPLTGLLKCARCGTAMRGSYGRSGRYYRDPAREHGQDCGLGVIGSEKAEAAVGETLRRLTLPADWQSRLLKLIEAQLGETRDLAQEKAKLDAQLERLKVLFTLGDITEREYLADRDRLRAQVAALTPPVLPDLERAAELIGNFGVIWDAASLAEQGRLIKTLLAAIHIDQTTEREVIVKLEPRKEFAMLFEMAT